MAKRQREQISVLTLLDVKEDVSSPLPKASHFPHIDSCRSIADLDNFRYAKDDSKKPRTDNQNTPLTRGNLFNIQKDFLDNIASIPSPDSISETSGGDIGEYILDSLEEIMFGFNADDFLSTISIMNKASATNASTVIPQNK